jgi:uncharacterized phage protein gp47/JayE
MTNNYIDETGLHLQSLTGIVAELESGFKTIYGLDVNVDANSPDGQMINLFAQAKIDILDCIAQVYGSFSPTAAVGVALDQRCAINGVFRAGATKTEITVNVGLDRQTPLVGINDGTGTPFAVKDNAGNRFYLKDGVTGATGTTGLAFIAENAGAITVTANSVKTIDTVTLGVTGVSGAASTTVQGIDEETDAQLRYRRARSVALPSQGYLDGLQAALLALDEVTHARVYENNTGATGATADGLIPPHSIWAVVEGGTGPDIIDVIYKKRPVGVGMKGGVTGTVAQTNGFDFIVKYDRPTLENLYINLVMTSLTGAHSIDESAVKQHIADTITYDINEVADYSAIAATVKAYDPYAVIISGFVGTTGATGSSYKYPTTIDSRWVISTAHIATTVS